MAIELNYKTTSQIEMETMKPLINKAALLALCAKGGSRMNQRKKLWDFLTWGIGLAGVLFLSGCVAGQHIQLSYNPPPAEMKVNSAKTIKVAVKDAREYVLNKDKSPSYIGHYRAGYGNTWDVTTDGKVALADKFAGDIKNELTSLGFSLNDTSPDRTLEVNIVEYNFDAYMNGKMWYEIKVRALDKAGNSLAESVLKDKVVIEGSVWVGAKYAFEQKVPVIYGDIVKNIVRNNKQVMEALK